MKAGALTRFTGGEEDAEMIFHDTFADGEADAGAFKFFPAMQALEQFKYPAAVFLRKTNPVIA